MLRSWLRSVQMRGDGAEQPVDESIKSGGCRAIPVTASAIAVASTLSTLTRKARVEYPAGAVGTTRRYYRILYYLLRRVASRSAAPARDQGSQLGSWAAS